MYIFSASATYSYAFQYTTPQVQYIFTGFSVLFLSLHYAFLFV